MNDQPSAGEVAQLGEVHLELLELERVLDTGAWDAIRHRAISRHHFRGRVFDAGVDLMSGGCSLRVHAESGGRRRGKEHNLHAA